MTSGDETRDDPLVADPEPRDRSTRATKLISRATAAAGSFPTILFAVGLVLIWIVGGIFVEGGYASTAYQLPVSTVSSIVTFVMVFVIQSTQNRDIRPTRDRPTPRDG